MDPVSQLSLFDDPTLDGRHVRPFRQPKPDYQVYLQTPQWRCRRSEIISRQKFKCARCYREKRLAVHHLSYAHLGDEYPEDLVALCLTCHAAVHEIERQRAH